MKLTDIFNKAIAPAEAMLCYYEELLTRNKRSLRPEWRKRFLDAKLVGWPQGTGIWRSFSRDKSVLILGTDASPLSHRSFEKDNLAVFLRSALVFAVAAVDKVLHESINLHFAKLAKEEFLDGLVNIAPSRAYSIAVDARVRRGRGGQIKSRPGNKIKTEVMRKIYESTYLSVRNIEAISKCFGHKNVFYAFGQTLSPKITAKEASNTWGHIYFRRNAIAHECDMIRKARMRQITYHAVSFSKIKKDIQFVKSFGQFLASKLQR